ncbi:MAG: hypothetical protein IPP96_17275 [Chitinophagaceae bacterium]|nr:hypothetical protein [Chitinophagaceae bacterium]
MSKKPSKWNILVAILLFSLSLFGQKSSDALITFNMSPDLIGDTLFFSTGLKIFIGQKLITGNPAGDAGQFRSIVSKKAAIVPSIWGQDMRYEHAIENYVDSKKNKEKVKKYLIPGTLLTVTKISYPKTGKPYFYLVSLSSDTDGYNCDIKFALLLKELMLEN